MLLIASFVCLNALFFRVIELVVIVEYFLAVTPVSFFVAVLPLPDAVKIHRYSCRFNNYYECNKYSPKYLVDVGIETVIVNNYQPLLM